MAMPGPALSSCQHLLLVSCGRHAAPVNHDALPCLLPANLLQAVAAVNEKLASGAFRLPGKQVVTTIEPAGDYYIAEARLLG